MEDVARAKKAEEEKKAEEARKSAARAARGRGAGSRGRGRGRGRGSDPTDELAALFEDLEVGGGGVEKETDNEEDLLAELEDPTQSLVPSPPSSSHSPHNSEDNWEGAEEELLPVVTRSGRTSRRGGAEVGWWGVTQIERDPGRERLHHKERYKKRSADSRDATDHDTPSTLTASPAPVLADDDTWLDTWDHAIHCCSACERPFGTASRLENHVREYHTPGAEKELPNYKRPETTEEDEIPAVDVELVPNGDLILQLSTKNILVSSGVLCAASPVFRQMFCTPDYEEAKGLQRAMRMGKPYVLMLEEDDPEAMELVLMMLHHQLPRDSKAPELKILVHIAEIADKYNVVEPIYLQTKKRREAYETYDILKEGFEDYLTIAWVFSMESRFDRLANDLTHRANVDETGTGIFFEGKDGSITRLSDTLPAIVIQKLLSIRHARLERLQNTFKEIKETYKTVPLDGNWPCKGSTYGDDTVPESSKRTCHAYQLGSLIQSTALYKLDDEKFWRGSPNAIFAVIKDILDVDYDCRSNEMHYECGWLSAIQEREMRDDKHVAKIEMSDFPSRKVEAKPKVFAYEYESD